VSKIFAAAAALSLALSASSCTTAPTGAGNQVRMVDDKERYNYQFLGTVSGYSTLALTEGGEAQNAMTEARNKAAKLGGNAIKVVHVQTTQMGTTVLAEVLRVDFSSRR
jgi:hypothetical protein